MSDNNPGGWPELGPQEPQEPQPQQNPWAQGAAGGLGKPPENADEATRQYTGDQQPPNPVGLGKAPAGPAVPAAAPSSPNPYAGMPAYPGMPPAGMPQAPPKPPMPQPVQVAFYLMIAGAVLSVLSYLAGFLDLEGTRELLVEQQADMGASTSEDAIDGLLWISLIIGAVTTLIFTGLWLWMAFANKAGHNWARIVASVFFGINAVLFIIGLVGASVLGVMTGVVGIIIQLLTLIVGLGAIFGLWHPRSGPFFAPAPPPYAQYPPHPGPM